MIRGTAVLAGCLGLTACIGPDAGPNGFESLVVGARVKVKGTPAAAGPALATEIEELDAKDGKPGKVEVVAPIERAEPKSLTVVGRKIAITEKTRYENARREHVDPFPIRSGQWFKVKARVKSRGRVQARKIRPVAADRQFRIEGFVTALDLPNRNLHVGDIAVRVADTADVQALSPEERVLGSDPLALFLRDDQKGVPLRFRLGDNLRLGGSLTLKLRENKDRDLRRNRNRNRTSLRLEAKLDGLWRFDERGSFAFAEATFGRRNRFIKSRPDTLSRIESLSRGYLYWAVGEDLRLQVGRQDFDDDREWLYNEVLDAARLRWTLGTFQFEVAAATGRELLDDANVTENTQAFVVMAQHSIDDHHRISAYFIQRKDTNLPNFEPQLVGLRSFLRRSRGLGHWVELAYAGGYVGRRLVRGFAVDLGAVYRFDAALRPTITLGYAMASGRHDGSTRVGFRQTGLQDNNGKFGGVQSFRYYGETLDPELANLHVTTVGLGIRPLRTASLDVVFHTYRQAVASTSLLATGLRASPTGTTHYLGRGFDLILGYRLRNRLGLQLLAAQFNPGHAFADNATAYKFEFVMRLGF